MHSLSSLTSRKRSPSPTSAAVLASFTPSFATAAKPAASAAEMQKLRDKYGDASGTLEGPASLGRFNTLKVCI